MHRPPKIAALECVVGGARLLWVVISACLGGTWAALNGVASEAGRACSNSI